MALLGLWQKKRKTVNHMNHVMRKPDYGICEHQRRRSACTSAQSDQHLCCSFPRKYNTSTCYIRNFKTLKSLTVYLAPLDSLPPGGKAVPGYLTPHPGYLHPRGASCPGRFILPPTHTGAII